MAVKLDFEYDKKNLKITGKPLINKRNQYLEAVDRILDYAFNRLFNRYTKNSEKLKWARIITSAVSAGNQVLRDQDLDSLNKRLKALEETK